MILLAASVAAYVLGGLGLANEEKRGYPVAVVAAFSPFILRGYLSFQVGRIELGFILGLSQPLSLLFEVALIAHSSSSMPRPTTARYAGLANRSTWVPRAASRPSTSRTTSSA